MRFEPTRLAGATVIELDRQVDSRGFFARSFCEREFAQQGLPTRFPQCNLSRNDAAGTLRGMHYDTMPSQESKLVRCVSGALFDVIIDLRAESRTRFQWIGVELTAENGRALFIPPGFAHGFITLVDHTDGFYQMGYFYSPGGARGLRYDDPFFGIAWPREPSRLSERDAAYPDFDPASLDG